MSIAPRSDFRIPAPGVPVSWGCVTIRCHAVSSAAGPPDRAPVLRRHRLAGGGSSGYFRVFGRQRARAGGRGWRLRRLDRAAQRVRADGQRAGLVPDRRPGGAGEMDPAVDQRARRGVPARLRLRQGPSGAGPPAACQFPAEQRRRVPRPGGGGRRDRGERVRAAVSAAGDRHLVRGEFRGGGFVLPASHAGGRERGRVRRPGGRHQVQRRPRFSHRGFRPGDLLRDDGSRDSIHDQRHAADRDLGAGVRGAVADLRDHRLAGGGVQGRLAALERRYPHLPVSRRRRPPVARWGAHAGVAELVGSQFARLRNGSGRGQRPAVLGAARGGRCARCPASASP